MLLGEESVSCVLDVEQRVSVGDSVSDDTCRLTGILSI